MIQIIKKFEDFCLKKGLLKSPIYIVEVGARKQKKKDLLPEPYYILKSKKILGFDADINIYKDLKRISEESPTIQFFPYALGDTEGNKEFYFTRNPKCSSLYEPDSQILNTFQGLDIVLTLKKEKIYVRRLDVILNEIGWTNIDFLKADVQGAELNVLIGAGKYLDKLLAVVVEVEFEEIYKKQPLFFDINSFLNDKGFFFHHFYQIGGAYLKEGLSVGQFRALWADVVYFREFDLIPDDRLCTYAILASIYDCHHLAVTALKRSPNASSILHKYQKLLEHYYKRKNRTYFNLLLSDLKDLFYRLVRPQNQR